MTLGNLVTDAESSLPAEDAYIEDMEFSFIQVYLKSPATNIAHHK